MAIKASKADNAVLFFELIQRYAFIDKLSEQILADLIDHIVVYDHDGGKPRRQKVKIVYRLAGATEVHA